MLGTFFRQHLCRALTGKTELALEHKIPSPERLRRRFEDISELGIYLHIPFCRQICPYCPYNKEIYCPDMARRYTTAVKREIDFYCDIVGRRPVTSLYVGGGTPTTMLNHGLPEILDHLREVFDVRCDVHLESHPNDLSSENLDAILSLGVRHLSTGVESLQDKHLRFLGRPYTAQSAKQTVRRAVTKGFQCVNVDLIFALPGQTCREVEQTAYALVEMGVDQVAAYPLFRFPYTVMGGNGSANNYGLATIFQRRRMLRILEDVFYGAGFERTSVWAFTRSGVPKYCSVTVPLYLGLGASGGSYLKDTFYLNTFNVAEYIKAVENRGTAIALSLDLSESMQMAGWLYWRIYETRFAKRDFQRRFGQDLEQVYGQYFKPLRLFGFLKDDGQQIVLTDQGTYWLHALEDLFSIDYISRLWGTAKQDPWPEKVLL
jgi:coproporphyrinogen III oxidase-like Fe-S oxidoreductase